MNLIVRPEVQQEAEEANVEREVQDDYGVTRKLCACGRMFTPYRPYQHYCSEAHRIKYSKGKASTYIKKKVETKKCKQCGKEFQTNDSKRHYCSKECYIQYQLLRRSKPEERVCFVCGKKFMTTHWSKRYCSDVCRMEAHR